MALDLKICVQQSDDRTILRITDTTGAYNATSNLGGWGAPNPAIGTATAATIFFNKRNADGTFTAYETVDVYSDLPSEDDGYIEITAEDAGFGTDATYPDGIYELTYTVSGTSGSAYTYVKTFPVYIDGGIKCCYKTKSAEVSTCSCGCEKIEEELIKIDREIRLLECAKNQGNYNLIQGYIDSLTRLCETCGCGCS